MPRTRHRVSSPVPRDQIPHKDRMTLLTATKDLEHSQVSVLARWLNSAEDSGN